MTKTAKNTYFSYFIFLLYLIYEMRGVIYGEGTFLSKSMVVVVISYGIYCMFANMDNFVNQKLPKIHIIFIFIISLYWIISPAEVNGTVGEAIGKRPTWDFLKCFLYANVSFYTFYNMGKKTNIGYRTLIIWVISLAVLKWCSMIIKREQIIYEALYDMKGVQMAAGYVFTGLIIYTLLIKEKTYRLIACTILLICVVFSAKRGSIILGCLLYVWVIFESFVRGERRIKLKTILLGVIVLIFVGYGVVEYISQDEFLMIRLEKTLEGDASNREEMFPLMMGIVNNSDIVDLIFGRGMIQSVNLIGNYAHNDWFETIIDFGIISFSVLILLFVRLFQFCKTADTSFKTMLYMTFIYLLFKSLVSMGIYSLESYLQFALIGFFYSKKQATNKGIVYRS